MALPKLSAQQPIVNPDRKPSSPFLFFMERTRSEQEATDARQDEADAAIQALIQALQEAVAAIQVALQTAQAAQEAVDNLTPADIGLGLVDNTADADKSVLEATRLTTPRNINGQPFDGTADITIAATDPSAAPTGRTLTAGAGLTGGGDLSANRTFNVGAGTGITVNADDIALTIPTAFGNYSPTGTPVANVSGLTPYQALWSRVGDMVNVSGLIDIQAGGAGQATFRLSLPVPSNISNTVQAGGTIAAKTVLAAGCIEADVANDEAIFNFIAANGVNTAYSFTFAYQVL